MKCLSLTTAMLLASTATAQVPRGGADAPAVPDAPGFVFDIETNEAFAGFLADDREFFRAGYAVIDRNVGRFYRSVTNPEARDPAGVLISDISSDDARYSEPVYNPTNIAYHAYLRYLMHRFSDAGDQAIIDFWLQLQALIDLSTGEDTPYLPYRFDWTAYPGYAVRAPWPSAIAQGFFIRSLIRAHAMTGEAAWLDLAEAHARILSVPVEDGGLLREVPGGVWFAEYPTEEPSLVLNGSIAALIALIELQRERPSQSRSQLIEDGINAVHTNISAYDYRKADGRRWSAYDLLDRPVGVTFRLLPLGERSPVLIDEIRIETFTTEAVSRIEYGDLLPAGALVLNQIAEIPRQEIFRFVPDSSSSDDPGLLAKSFTLTTAAGTTKIDFSTAQVPVDSLNMWASAPSEHGREAFGSDGSDGHSVFFVNHTVLPSNDSIEGVVSFSGTVTGDAPILLQRFDRDAGRYTTVARLDPQSSETSIEVATALGLVPAPPGDPGAHLVLETDASPIASSVLDVGSVDDAIGSLSHIHENNLHTWGPRDRVGAIRDAFGRAGRDGHAGFRMWVPARLFDEGLLSTITIGSNKVTAPTALEVWNGERYIHLGLLKPGNATSLTAPLPMFTQDLARTLTGAEDPERTESSTTYHHGHIEQLKTLYGLTGNRRFLHYATEWYRSLDPNAFPLHPEWDEVFRLPKPARTLDESASIDRFAKLDGPADGIQNYRLRSISEVEDRDLVVWTRDAILEGLAPTATSRERVLRFLHFASNNIGPGNPPRVTATSVIESAVGICGGRTALFLELCRSVGLPARRVNLENLALDPGHTTAEVFFAGSWHWFDPTDGHFLTDDGSLKGRILSAQEIARAPELWPTNGFSPTRLADAMRTGRVVAPLATPSRADSSALYTNAVEMTGHWRSPRENFTSASHMYHDHDPAIPIEVPLVVESPPQGEWTTIGDPKAKDLDLASLARRPHPIFGSTGTNHSNIGIDAVGVNRRLLLGVTGIKPGSTVEVELTLIGHSGGTFTLDVEPLFGWMPLSEEELIIDRTEVPGTFTLRARATRPTAMVMLNHRETDYARLVQSARIRIRTLAPESEPSR
ncbi:MAG: D-glucuronyl C5-epimerase family protein [Planctomycetota bacterium]